MLKKRVQPYPACFFLAYIYSPNNMVIRHLACTYQLPNQKIILLSGSFTEQICLIDNFPLVNIHLASWSAHWCLHCMHTKLADSRTFLPRTTLTFIHSMSWSSLYYCTEYCTIFIARMHHDTDFTNLASCYLAWVVRITLQCLVMSGDGTAFSQISMWPFWHSYVLFF